MKLRPSIVLFAATFFIAGCSAEDLQGLLECDGTESIDTASVIVRALSAREAASKAFSVVLDTPPDDIRADGAALIAVVDDRVVAAIEAVPNDGLFDVAEVMTCRSG